MAAGQRPHQRAFFLGEAFLPGSDFVTAFVATAFRGAAFFGSSFIGAAFFAALFFAGGVRNAGLAAVADLARVLVDARVANFKDLGNAFFGAPASVRGRAVAGCNAVSGAEVFREEIACAAMNARTCGYTWVRQRRPLKMP